MKKGNRPKIRDVAKLAGVSEGTVSVVLNGKVGENVRVSDSTQESIWDAVRKLGYVANPMAQSLAGGRNHIIAVFTFESIFPISSNDFYYPFLIGIEEEAERHGYDLLLVTGRPDKARDTKRHIYQNGINRLQRADGAILLGEGDPQEVYQLLDEGYPFTFVGKRNSPQDNISYCAADYVTASMEVTDYLFKNGHRKIAYFRSQNPTEATQDRIEGFRAAYQRNNIELNESWIVDVSQGITLDLLLDHLNSGFSAFIAENDDIGRRILDTGGLSELECPRDYSLAVFGDPLNPIDDMPGWTHFSIPRRAMGREALNLLVNILNVESNEITEPLRKTLPCTFIQGSTVKTV